MLAAREPAIMIQAGHSVWRSLTNWWRPCTATTATVSRGNEFWRSKTPTSSFWNQGNMATSGSDRAARTHSSSRLMPSFRLRLLAGSDGVLAIQSWTFCGLLGLAAGALAVSSCRAQTPVASPDGQRLTTARYVMAPNAGKPVASATRRKARWGLEPDQVDSLGIADLESAHVVVASTEPSVVIHAEPVEREGQHSRPGGAIAAAVAEEQAQVWNVGGRSDPSYLSNRSNFHPGTRVRVDAELVGYRRTKRAAALSGRIQAGLRNRGYWPFRNCFEAVARQHADPGGRTWLRITVAVDGAVSSTRLLRTDLRHREIAECHARAARRLRLEDHHVGRASVNVMVAVWPGDVALLPLPQIPAGTANRDLSGLTRDLGSIESGVAACMREARRRDPKLWGRLALSFGIDARGRASNIREFQSQFGDTEAIGCVTKLVEELTFPQPIGGAFGEPKGSFVAAWRLHPAAVGAVAEPQQPLPISPDEHPSPTDASTPIGATPE